MVLYIAMNTKLLAAVALATSVAAQDREISSCSALSCINTESQGVCASGNSSRTVGVGMVSEVLDISDEKLSLTLVDGSPDGILATQEGYQFSTQTLYVGVPSNFNSSNQGAGCALMMQYQEQAFELSEDNTQNTTSCSSVISDGCQNSVATLVEQFRYTTNGQSNDTGSDSLPRCESLAQFLNTNIHRELSFCDRFAGHINITGGPISGENLSPSSVQLQNEGCQPVIPESYELRRVAEMRQILPTGENSDQSLGGRSGVTPVFTVVYDGENDNSPEVQFTCMRTFTAEGEEMPDSLNGDDDKSGAVSTGHGATAAVAATLLSFVFLLG
ncbi:hypothetical protein CkaCkLH20_05477 [Colletotrichum karsti]|uniref:GPI-anchored protein n=1 Tax=Colletotrichum karsti TaxID=1095194 RepID=A0A9P6I8Q0_9PEZI|nr:uncharacterized protein CkaCkLH20_05477 [Colletotrichum karsti]KAF9877211.1 hypothetical protein CkaCkLH20_05477 [Colletotrichum karsti]